MYKGDEDALACLIFQASRIRKLPIWLTTALASFPRAQLLSSWLPACWTVQLPGSIDGLTPRLPMWWTASMLEQLMIQTPSYSLQGAWAMDKLHYYENILRLIFIHIWNIFPSLEFQKLPLDGFCFLASFNKSLDTSFRCKIPLLPSIEQGKWNNLT